MANTAAVPKSFRVELLNGIHAFGTSVVRAGTGADTFKMALYLATATINADTTAYTGTGELAATGNYTAGGVTLTNATAPANTGGTGIVAFWTPSAAATWTALTSSGSFDCALIYNSTQSNKAVGVFTFGAQNVTAGNFTINMPTNDLTTGLIRIS
jgi:hypothetical protein